MEKNRRGKSAGGVGAKERAERAPAEMRERIMEAAHAVLMDCGYARASTLEIASRAKVSKRELYAQFGDKRGVLVAMISRRSARMHGSLTLPLAADRAALAATLNEFGATILREVCHPTVTALFRLAISEADRDPELARILDENGRGAHRAALVAFLSRIGAAGLLGDADPETVASQFLSLLFGDVLLRVILHAVAPPSPRACAARARAATEAVLRLYPAISPA